MTIQRKAIIAVFVISFVLLTYNVTGTVIPYIANTYQALENLDYLAVSQLLSFPALFGLVTSFIIGPIAMRVNKKWLLALGGLLVLGYFAVFSIVGANGPFSRLYIAAALAGITQGMTFTLVGAVLGEFVGAANSAVYVAAANALLNGGGALMSVIGGRIAAGNGGADWPKTYTLGLILVPIALLAFIILMPLKPENSEIGQAGQGGGATGADEGKLPKRIYFIGLLGVTFSIAICGFLFYISQYIVNVHQLGTTAQAGDVNTAFTATGIVMGLTYSIWSKMLKNNLIFVSFFAASTGLLCMWLWPSLIGAFASAILIGFGFNLMNPWIIGFILQICPPRLGAVGISFLMAGANLGMLIAPYVLSGFGSMMASDPVGQMGYLVLLSVVLAYIGFIASFFVYSAKGTPLEGSHSHA